MHYFVYYKTAHEAGLKEFESKKEADDFVKSLIEREGKGRFKYKIIYGM